MSQIPTVRSAETWLELDHDALVCDVLIVGSGYGGSFAARELAASHTDVWLVERGRAYQLGEFPDSIGALPGHVRLQTGVDSGGTGNADALLDLRLHDEVAVLVANGLGGGSLINAGVAVQPDPALFQSPDWPGHYRRSATNRQVLVSAMVQAQAQLQAQPFAPAHTLAKFQALQALGRPQGQSAWRVPVTVASTDQTSPAGVEQSACTLCGNCFTGCNVGAKNTLVTHVLPDALRQGAQVFTGATALEVRPQVGSTSRTPQGRPVRWRVRMVLTDGKNQPATRRECWVMAHMVVLSAGTLGSTEILLKSSQLALSPQLGRRFSTNGDVLALGWGMADAAHGMAESNEALRPVAERVGPTITGALAPELMVGGGLRRVLIEDGAVPSAMTQAVVALAATLSLAHRYHRHRPPAHWTGADPLSTPPDAGRHALLLLAMGPDDADGRIALQSDAPSAETTASAAAEGREGLTIRWAPGPYGPRSPYYEAVHQWMRQAADQGGFQGGDYLANPLWRALPDEFDAIAPGTAALRGVTVHPLGGCAMGDDPEHGVVDWRGEVFRPDGTRHAGLHVLDGAMLPSAVGVNPFITIAGLSLVAARALHAELILSAAPATGQPQPVDAWAPLQAVAQERTPTHPHAAEAPVYLRFREHLQGGWRGEPPGWLPQVAPTLTPEEAGRAWVAAVDVPLNLADWLANPSVRLEGARMRLYRNPSPQALSVQADALGATPVLEGEGWLRLLALDAPAHGLATQWRTLKALRAFLCRRGLAEAWSLVGTSPSGAQPSLLGSLKQAWRSAVAFWVAGMNHAQYRTLDYEFVLQAPGGRGEQVRAYGQKRLAYAHGQKTLWNALVQLDLTMAPAGSGAAATLSLEADLVDMVRRQRLQVTQATDTPTAIVGLAAFGAVWVRALLQTHFWAFRGPNYTQLHSPAAAQHGPLWPQGLQGTAVAPERIELQVPRYQAQTTGGERLCLELTRYTPTLAGPATGRHLLMIHGLAHGATVFSTDTTQGRNMASAYLAEGWTVWLLDHRLSNRLGRVDAGWRPYATLDHTVDDVAALDIAAAVARVAREAGGPIDVFAHCVGAAAFAMATLSGRLAAPGGASLVRGVAIHAVHPWVVPSASNQLSGELAALYKDWLPEDLAVHPVPPSSSATGLDQVVDRLAATLPWPEQELGLHRADQHDAQGGMLTCNRMTLFYGREWVHGNLAPATHRQLASLVGPASVSAFQHLYFMVTRQQLTDHRGADVYMGDRQFREHWTFPTLFCHGSENRVFDPRSAVRSWHQLRLLAQRGEGAPAKAPVRLFMAEGYGHMDFLFGQNAHRDVYPSLVSFLLQPSDFRSSYGSDGLHVEADHAQVPSHWRDAETGPSARPLTGPLVQLQPAVLASAQQTAQPRELVLWVEMPHQPLYGPCVLEAVALDAHDQPLPQLVGRAVRLESVLNPELSPGEAVLLQGPGAYWVLRLPGGGPTPLAALHALQLRLRHGTANADLLTQGPRVQLAGHVWWARWLASGPDKDPGKPISQALCQEVSWLATSCRWPGTAFERDAVDQLAGRMADHVNHPSAPAQALVLLGDQIYADATANLLDTRGDDERLAQMYRDAWGSPQARSLLSSLPSYGVVDDHELGDNWAGSASTLSGDRVLVNGFEAALAYQWRWSHPSQHLPGLFATTGAGTQVRGFWRRFQIGPLLAYAMDTRTERAREGAQAAQLCSAEQLADVKAWLLAHRTEPKVLCSGSVFGWVERRLHEAPTSSSRCDGWCAYPETWRSLVQFVVHERIEHLVFLSGDYHFSGVAELGLQASGHEPVRALSVVCSGWNATLPFANASPADFVIDRTVALPCSDEQVGVVSLAKGLGTQLRQFSKLSVRPNADGGWTLVVVVYGEDGAMVAATEHVL